jgi:hypothetical protein
MCILRQTAAALKRLFGPLAEEAAQDSGVIVRQRKFTPLSLAKTFVLGFLHKPDASDEELARIAAQCGTFVTPQAVDQRQTSALTKFLEALFRRAIPTVVGTDRVLAKLLERFADVTVLDSSTIRLPDSLSERFPGCGGSHGSGLAAMKLQTELSLRTGAVTHVEIESGRSSDGTTSRQYVERGKGTLRITDLGYFCIAVFAALCARGEYFLSRLQFGTGVSLTDGTVIDLLKWLPMQSGPFVDCSILLGLTEQLPCRLIAWRLPPEQANRRRQKLRDDLKRKKKGKEPTAERLAWCDWTILVTNTSVELLSPQEAAVLYRARWQVELLFKRWKSQGRVAQLDGTNEVRQMIRLWGRLLAVMVQHWLMVGTAWGDPTKSAVKVYEAVRSFVGRLLDNLAKSEEDVLNVLSDLAQVVAKTCRRNSRSKPGTFELLNDVNRLDFCLT